MDFRRLVAQVVIALSAALVAYGAAAATPGDRFSSPEPPEVTVRRYLQARASLNAIRTVSPAQVVGASATARGHVVEFAGKITGRTVQQTRRGIDMCFLLRPVGADEEVFIAAPDDSPLIALANQVHVLAELPNGDDTRYNLRCIVRTIDLPESEWWGPARPPKPVPIEQQVCRVDVNPVKDGLYAPEPPPPAEPAQPQAQPQAPVSPARPGTEFPEELLPPTDERVAVWMQWVKGRNSRLTDSQVRLIVESVLYYSYKYSIDHRLAFAMIRYESDFNPRCTSHAGAMGLTQLMPGTAKWLGVTDAYDIQQNIMGGIRYLSEQLYSFEGLSSYEQTILGLAAYNAGPGAVKRAGGVPNITETRNYVKRVSALFLQLHESGMP